MKTPRFTWNGNLSQKKPVFVILFCWLFSLSVCNSQESTQLSQQKVLSQIIQSLPGQEPTAGNGEDAFVSKLIVENAIPSFVRDKFKTSEEFGAFASRSLLSNVSTECGSSLLELVNQLGGLLSPGGHFQLPATWAIQMVDAWGKFPAGILSGHTQITGDYAECLQIRGNYTNQGWKGTSDFRGLYCTTVLAPVLPSETATIPATPVLNKHTNGRQLGASPRGSISPAELLELASSYDGAGVNLFPVVGTCFPSACSKQDVETLFLNFYRELFQGQLQQPVLECYTDEKPPFDAATIAVISLLSVIAFLCLAGSVYDVLIYRRNPKSGPKSASKVDQYFLAFSVPLNTEKWMSTKVGAGDLTCLHGMRYLSICWVLLGHSWEQISSGQLTWNLIDLSNMYRPFMLQIVINGTVAVDTFFVISGTLMCYNLLRELEKRKGTFNYPLMVLHRYLRLTPTYAVVIGFLATLWPYLASGPMAVNIIGASEMCRKNWWHNLLYINNFEETWNDMCYGQAWYLANDMQFFLFAPIIIYPLYRWRKAGFAVLAAFSTASILAPALIQNLKELPPVLGLFIPEGTLAKDIYYSPWGRMAPYIVGIFLGYVLYYKSKNEAKFRNIRWLVIAGGWLLSTGTALAVVFGAQNFMDPANAQWTYTSLNSTFYVGLSRFAWGGVIAWIIFACVSGYGGFVNRFLSWKVFVPLGRLTYCIYITSFPIQQLYHINQIHPVHYSMYAHTNIYFAHFVMTGLVAFVVTITMEAPFMQLEKLLLPQKKSAPKAKAELPHTINANNQ